MKKMNELSCKGVFTLRYEQIDSPKGSINKIFLTGIKKNGEKDSIEVEYTHLHLSKLEKPDVLDGFVCAVIFYLMEHAHKLKVQGALSYEFVRNIRIFGEAWQSWRPDLYAPVEVEAITYKYRKNPSFMSVAKAYLGLAREKKSLLTFSGGVDACFSLMRHAKKNGSLTINQRYGLADVVMVQGFDVAYTNDVAFSDLIERVQPILSEFGVKCFLVKTNIREKVPQNWEHSFGAQIASVLHQFSPQFSHGIIGSSEPYTNMVNAWGSHPATDHLFSGGELQVVHDGAGFSRTQKVSQIASIDAVTNNLKVCWEGVQQQKNCGVCEKCIRTKLNFLATGNRIPNCFDNELKEEQILSVPIRNLPALEEFNSIVHQSRLAGTSENKYISALIQRLIMHSGS